MSRKGGPNLAQEICKSGVWLRMVGGIRRSLGKTGSNVGRRSEGEAWAGPMSWKPAWIRANETRRRG